MSTTSGNSGPTIGEETPDMLDARNPTITLTDLEVEA